MKQKNLYKRLEQLQKENKIPDDAKVIVVYNGIPAEVRSLHYDLDNYDDPEWSFVCNDDEGNIDIDTASPDDNDTKNWADSLKDYVSYPITFGKLMKVMGELRHYYDEVCVRLDKYQRESSPIVFVDEHAEFGKITKNTKFQYDSAANEVRIPIHQKDVYRLASIMKYTS